MGLFIGVPQWEKSLAFCIVLTLSINLLKLKAKTLLFFTNVFKMLNSKRTCYVIGISFHMYFWHLVFIKTGLCTAEEAAKLL